MNRYEQAKITSIIAEYGVHFHLGLKFNKDTKTWEWINGHPFTYSHWAEFEPGNQTINYFIDMIYFKILSITTRIVLGGVLTCTDMMILDTGK